jgi:hypothetical protein
LQVRVTPTDEAWQKKGQEVVDKILGKKKAHKKSFLAELADIPLGAAMELVGIGGHAEPPKKEEQPKMLQLSPREKKILEEVQEKLAQVGFMCKIRVVYVAKRNVFNKGRLGQLRGAFAQLQTTDMNGFKGYAGVTPKNDYFWQRWSENERKHKLIAYYKGRSGKGASAYALSIAELATLYHFPMTDVKAPLIVKTDSKRGEPPTSLPSEDRFPAAYGGVTSSKFAIPGPEDQDDDAPGNLPVA